MKVLFWFQLLLRVMEEGWVALDKFPPTQALRLKVQRRFAQELRHFPSTFTLYLILGLLVLSGFWMSFFAFYYPMSRSQATAEPPMYAHQVGPKLSSSSPPELAAILLNRLEIREAIVQDMNQHYPELDGAVHLQVKVGPSGEYLTHRVVSADHPLLPLLAQKHLPQMDCLPALYRGRAVSAWIDLHFFFYP